MIKELIKSPSSLLSSILGGGVCFLFPFEAPILVKLKGKRPTDSVRLSLHDLLSIFHQSLIATDINRPFFASRESDQ